MDFSVICIYNNIEIYESNLSSSIKKQKYEKYELIEINNSNSIYSSAAIALNQAAKSSIGKYLVFVHQDISFFSRDTFEKIKEYLDGIQNLGIAGCIGVKNDGEYIGLIRDRDVLLGKVINAPTVAETLDECLLIVERATFFDNGGFDEKIRSWHCYGVDFSLRMNILDKKVCVLPIYVWHNSPATNIKNLIFAQAQIMKKYNIKKVYTTAGIISYKGFVQSWLRYNTPQNIKKIVLLILLKFEFTNNEYKLSMFLDGHTNPNEMIGMIHFIDIPNQELNRLDIFSKKLRNNSLYPEFNIKHYFVKNMEEIENLLLNKLRIIVISNYKINNDSFKIIYRNGFKINKKFKKYSVFIRE